MWHKLLAGLSRKKDKKKDKKDKKGKKEPSHERAVRCGIHTYIMVYEKWTGLLAASGSNSYAGCLH